MSDKDKVELAAAYALDTVTPEERAEIDAILSGTTDESYDLAVNIEEFSQTATRLGLAADPVVPPASLKASLLAAIATTPQNVPHTEEPAGDTVSDAPAREVAPAPAVPTLPPVGGKRAPVQAPGRRESEITRTWFMRPSILASAAVAALVLFVGGLFIGQALVPTAPVGPEAVLAQLYDAPDLGKATSDLADGGSATLVYSAELGRSALLVDGLEALPEGKTYELWYINDANGAVPAGTFEPTEGGASVRVLDGSFTPGDVVGVTVEPDGGSDQPTSEPVLAVQSA